PIVAEGHRDHPVVRPDHVPRPEPGHLPQQGLELVASLPDLIDRAGGHPPVAPDARIHGPLLPGMCKLAGRGESSVLPPYDLSRTRAARLRGLRTFAQGSANTIRPI